MNARQAQLRISKGKSSEAREGHFIADAAIFCRYDAVVKGG